MKLQIESKQRKGNISNVFILACHNLDVHFINRDQARYSTLSKYLQSDTFYTFYYIHVGGCVVL